MVTSLIPRQVDAVFKSMFTLITIFKYPGTMSAQWALNELNKLVLRFFL